MSFSPCLVIGKIEEGKKKIHETHIKKISAHTYAENVKVRREIIAMTDMPTK